MKLRFAPPVLLAVAALLSARVTESNYKQAVARGGPWQQFDDRLSHEVASLSAGEAMPKAPASNDTAGARAKNRGAVMAIIEAKHPATTERRRVEMRKSSLKLLAAAGVLAFAGHAAADFPLMNMVADKVIQKYQAASCEQLWAQKQQPKSEQEQRLIGLLKNDPQLRTAFMNKVAGPIANKMFECGMIP